MTKIFQKTRNYVGPGRHGTHSSKPKSVEHADKESIPTTGRPVTVYLKEPYASILSEMYPDVPLSRAIRQFIIDNIDKKEQ